MGPLRIQGTGGVIWDMDVPREGTHERERFIERILNGDLLVLDDDGVPIERNTVVAELGGDVPVIDDVDALDRMTVKQLKARADVLKIDLGTDRRNKAELIALIRAYEDEHDPADTE